MSQVTKGGPSWRRPDDGGSEPGILLDDGEPLVDVVGSWREERKRCAHEVACRESSPPDPSFPFRSTFPAPWIVCHIRLAVSTACPRSSNSCERSPPRVRCPPVPSATLAVCQSFLATATACVGSGVPPAPKAWFGPPFDPSEERIVDQRWRSVQALAITCSEVIVLRGPPGMFAFIRRCASSDLLSSFATAVGHSERVTCLAIPRSVGFPRIIVSERRSPSALWGVGHGNQEETLSVVSGSNIGSFQSAPGVPIPEFGKRLEYFGKSPSDDGCDVLKEDVAWSHFANDAHDLKEESGS